MLSTRILSAAVLAPITLFIVWRGALVFELLVAVAVGIMAWEWERLTGGAGEADRSPHLALLGFVTVMTAALAGHVVGLVVFILGSLVVEGLRPPRPTRAGLWPTGGLVWITLPCVGLIWLRSDPIAGAQTVAWLLATVWAVDTAAYAVGKTLGGPKLAPRISPSKTWSGLLAGVMAATVVGTAAGFLMGSRRWPEIAAIGAVLALIEQGGDLAESYAKRRFGAKDSGSIIPGHGGLLDRLDGMLAVVVAVVLLDWGLGESVLLWR